MKCFIVAVLLAGMACGKPVSQSAVHSSPLPVNGMALGAAVAPMPKPVPMPKPESLKVTIRRLRSIAAARGLHFKVACAPVTLNDPSHEFMAYANVPGHGSDLSIEAGGQPDWFVYGATQQEAALHLINALQGEPNLYPDHEIVKKPHECPPPIEGGLPE
jgi:hypothetical protein